MEGLELTARTAIRFRKGLLFLDHCKHQVDELTPVLENIAKVKGLNTCWALIEKRRLCEVAVVRVSTERHSAGTPHRIEWLGAGITISLLNCGLSFIWHKDLPRVFRKYMILLCKILDYTKRNKQKHFQVE